MDASDTDPQESADVFIDCVDFDASLTFYTEGLGFRVDAIVPADQPRRAMLSGYGLRVMLERSGQANATRAQPPSLEITRLAEGGFGAGRAGMQYRDLSPGRFGGRYVASQIRIVTGGPVPDYVHYHDIRFQMIFCTKGWVRVAYQDQGEPMRMEAGDCFLQPPGIRHRVLECSDGLEVVEIASPAEHPTYADHDMDLPTAAVSPGREFGGQRFVFDRARDANWRPGPVAGSLCRDTGIGDATNGLASVVVVRAGRAEGKLPLRHDAEFRFVFVIAGSAQIDGGGAPLVPGDAITVPHHTDCTLIEPGRDLEFLRVTVRSG